MYCITRVYNEDKLDVAQNNFCL